MSERGHKPLGRKAYGSIGHLPSSRLGSGDRHVHDGQARICTSKTRDRHDVIFVQEKLDGSACAVAKVGGRIAALGRAGYLAQTSPFEQHQLFASWVREREDTFARLLDEGERVVGEWLAQAHGTRYDASHPAFRPFIVFDLMVEDRRITFERLRERLTERGVELMTPTVIATGPTSVEDVAGIIADDSHHGAIDPVEGAVWRVERRGEVDFLAKWVRPDKVDGCYLPEVSGGQPIWNWRPETR